LLFHHEKVRLRIESLAVRFPSLKVTNADLLARIQDCNAGVPRDQVRLYQRQLSLMMSRSGCETRYFRDRSKHETAMPFILDAARDAIAQSKISAGDVGLLLYCGVGRGFLEPAMAYFVAQALGLECECFDVVDACMSWVRALSIADSFFRQNSYAYIVIVNGEFNIYEAGYPSLLKADDPDKWRYSFPAFTIGEAATATVLSASQAPWAFHFRSDPSRVALCTLPLPGYQDYSVNSDGLARNGPNHFMSYGAELSRAAVEEMAAFVRATYSDPGQFDLWFPHAASTEACSISAEQLNLGSKLYYDTFPRYGNLVSASIPAAIDSAVKENRLTRGSKVVLCPASAGMSFALVDFVY
jgi:3-oxoacyl-[acyl-carrier-protein] synthase III